jgi:plasmid maintenance system killer protein
LKTLMRLCAKKIVSDIETRFRRQLKYIEAACL